MFEQFAQGEFTVEVKGDFHCGPNHDSPKTFKWEVMIEWPDSALDPKGFLLDNLTFKGFFDRCLATELSCEKLAKYCAEELWALCGGKAINLQVNIWAIKDQVRIGHRIQE